MTDEINALHQKWQAWFFNKFVLDQIRAGVHVDELTGALQPYTVEALHRAETFCWHPEPIAAVLNASRTLPDEVRITDSVFKRPIHLAQRVPTTGWWWFTNSLPISTVTGPEPVCALLWDHTPGVMAWCSAFVVDSRLPTVGTPTMPTVAFRWDMNVRLCDLAENLRVGYGRAQKHGEETLGLEGTVDASMRLARFFIAGMVWLEQRILVREPGEGTGTVGRQLQRTHNLDQRPKVTVVQLRRRDTPPAPTGTAGRTYSCRWVVSGHWRNQPYGPAGSKQYRPIWIEGYIKGPADQPLRETQKIFSVKR